MNSEKVKSRIQKYLYSSKTWPIIVDFQNKKDLADLKEYFNTGFNKFLFAEDFCEKDSLLKIEEFYKIISSVSSGCFVTDFSAFLKIQGEDFTKTAFRTLINLNTISHIVIFTYQCKNYLRFTDPRIVDNDRVIFVDGEPDEVTDVSFISPELESAFPGCYSGFEKLAHIIENSTSQSVYIATEMQKSYFPESIFNIHQMSNGYDILCTRDSRTKNMPHDFGTAEQWNYALTQMGANGNWEYVVNENFGSVNNLANSISTYDKLDDNLKWLYYISLVLFGAKNNAYLQHAINNTADYQELVQSLYRAILHVDHKDSEFRLLYNQRKEILRNFADSPSEATDFCKVVGQKGADAIHYLTDVTQPEKERIIKWLDNYGENYTKEELEKILNIVYPDLAAYLSKYRFKNDLLDRYFDEYKYLKTINKISPEFETMVDEQSVEPQFATILKPRTSLVEKIDLKNSQAYFVDAMGVEYLGYVQSKCNQYGLSASITCGYCELPSLTCFNKEFIEYFENNGVKVSDIKDLDEIKHHGENSFDYEKVKTPLYLTSELDIINDLLKKIRTNISNGYYDKAIIISDHGASRLAVIHESENIWSMETTGVHSGRCCPANEINERPGTAIEQENYWVLTNYDRFKGGRKANVEVHGGATLEEVTVPIIEITKKPSKIEVFVTDSSREILIGAMEFASLQIYVGIKSNDISVCVNGKYYDAEKTNEDYIYSVPMSDIKRKGFFTADVYLGNTIIEKDIKFEVKKKGMSTNNLFGF